MSAHRSLGKNYALPNNPVFVDFPSSDGNSALWPKNITKVVGSDGHVNFMDPLSLDHPMAIKWRVQVGDAVALSLNWDKDKNHVLSSFPKGYQIYDHNKGPEDKPRHDIYLIGGPSRFRSVPEFVPHAVWLFNGQKDSCGCKYCTKQPQKGITASMSPVLRSSPAFRQPTIRQTHGKRNNPAASHLREQKIYATVQKALLQASKHLASPHTMVVERNQDLRAVNSRSGMRLKRWFREGELLWCALSPPIPGPNDLEDAIMFWPGLVDEARVSAASVSSPDAMADNSAPWSVEQYTTYKVKLIATSDMISIPDHQVLPYQAYVPSPRLLETLAQTPAADLNFDKEYLSTFHPFPGSLERAPSFAEAVSSYALALQIGSSLAQLWSLTDEWEFKYSLPQPPSGKHQPTPLQAAIEMAGSSSQSLGTNGVMEPNVNMVGVVPFSMTSARSQTRYQGLWWGAERIWTDDFLRLKVPRRCLAPSGAQNILAPSGPGTKTKETCMNSGLDYADFGAGTRGVFLRLDGLFTVDVQTSDGKIVKECRASGMLYELADADWESPEATTFTTDQEKSHLPTIDPRSPNAQLSHPSRSAHYHLPEAPPGFKFRPILPEGYESILSLTLISGRYYPNILAHPLLSDAISKATQPDLLQSSDYLWALEGLAAGYTNSVDPERYAQNRLKMLDEADNTSRMLLEKHRNDAMEETQENSFDDALMDFED